MSKNTSTLAQLRRRYEENPPLMSFSASTKEQMTGWQRDVRVKLRSLLRLDRLACEDSCSPGAEVVDRFEEDMYVGEKMLIRTQTDMWVPAWILVPKRAQPPFPSILCFHGHGMSKDITIGRPTTDDERSAVTRFRSDYGRRFAEQGYLCFCPDARGFGQRDDPRGCQQICLNALAVDYVLTGLRVWDHLRCLDYLLSREDVDATRVGAAGLSMGCEHAMYTAVLDERIAAVVLSCCLRDLRRDILDAVYCLCSYVPGLLAQLDWPDIACAIAPRPVLVQQGNADYVPIASAEAAVAKLRQAYDMMGAADRIGSDYFDGGHQFNFTPALSWMDEWLRC